MNLLIICLFWLSGFIPTLFYCKIRYGEVTVGDCFMGFIAGIIGPISWICMGTQILQDSDFFDKKLF